MLPTDNPVARWGQRLLVAYAFLCPWVYGFAITDNIRVAAVDLLLLPCLLLIMLLMRQGHVTWLMVVTLAHIVAVPLSVAQWFGSEQFFPLFLKALRMVGIVAPAILIYVMPLGAVRLETLLRAFYYGGLASVVAGLAGFFLQVEALTAVQTYYYGPYVFLRRAGGVFRDSAAYSHLLATWAAMAFLWLYCKPQANGLKRVAFIVSTVGILAVGLYATLARAALLNIVMVAVALVALTLPRRLSPQRALALLAALACLILAPLYLEVKAEEEGKSAFLPLQRMVSTLNSFTSGVDAMDASGGGRLTSWRKSLAVWAEAPLLGIGYKALIPAHGIAADNNLILALVETGLFGAVSLFLLGLACTANLVRHYLNHSFACTIVLAIWLGQLAHSLTADIFTFMGSMPMVLMVVFLYQRLPPRFRVVREVRAAHPFLVARLARS